MPVKHDHRRLGQGRQIGQAMGRGGCGKKGVLAMEGGQQQSGITAAAGGCLQGGCGAGPAEEAQHFRGWEVHAISVKTDHQCNILSSDFSHQFKLTRCCFQTAAHIQSRDWSFWSNQQVG